MSRVTTLRRSTTAIAAALMFAVVSATADGEEPGAREQQAQEQKTRQKWCVSFHEIHPSITAAQAQQGGTPASYQVYPSDVQGGDLLLREEPVLHGGHMADAQAAFDQYTSLPLPLEVRTMVSRSGSWRSVRPTGSACASGLTRPVCSRPRSSPTSVQS